ncbi:MAG: arsenate reductase (glutaredoxin) [Pseudomonadales bacterium]|nr:arsenate reductase (glutaredoxin) [Pseudomonadales bacterium]
MSVKIYHNPRCSKSRTTLKLLQEKGIEPEIILYLETPPSTDEIKRILSQLGLEPKKLIRFNEAIAKELAIKASDDKSESDWIKLMSQNPKLIERPIVVKGDKAVIGRPPENIDSLV